MADLALRFYLTIRNWLQSEEGQDVVEYAVLVIFIALLVIAGVNAFGDQMKAVYDDIVEVIQGGLVPPPVTPP